MQSGLQRSCHGIAHRSPPESLRPIVAAETHLVSIPGHGDLLAWLLFFFMLVALLAIIVYQLMCLADLEFDYINPYDSASRINQMVLPEFITQGVVRNSKCKYMRRKHLVDVTEIFNQLNWEKKQRPFKLGYLITFLVITIVFFACGF
ncbi:protein cornichon homolog 4-like [Actinidia eriantha]|uniref:protein cornichon homolog 4-like n=1 Tax=Actinidia eriantha TaxID=165200 RepID=UPI00258E218E|nr:protein cornichon homolog 4-like [Actinidia eriantha]